MMMSSLDILDALISFDTTSSRSNVQCVQWIKEYLETHGVACSLGWNEDSSKASIVATIGPAAGGGILLSGHTDVVPVTGQTWSTDPFRLTRRDNRVHGRGATDMKGFLALVLAAVPIMTAGALRCPFHIALSYDEELGCIGTPSLIDALPIGAARPKLAIVGEPTGWQVANRHKGSYALDTTVIGRAAHSSRPELGVNAISYAARIIGMIEAIGQDLARSEIEPENRTTVSVGLVQGGIADNIVPDRCSFTWGLRTPRPGDLEVVIGAVQAFVSEHVLPNMRGVAAEASVEIILMREVPALVPTPAAGQLASLVAGLAGQAGEARSVAFGTEAGHFARAGIPAIVWGPGSIEQAHQPDEWLDIDQLTQGAALLERLVSWAREHDVSELTART